MYYIDCETSYIRIIEYKWFKFTKDANDKDILKTVISREYSTEWRSDNELYYTVNDEKNQKFYASYRSL